jgi:hypothetical protein
MSAKPCPICGRSDKPACKPGEEADKCTQAVMFDQFGEHSSDCAVYNEPAMPAGPCNCGGFKMPDASTVAQDDLAELLGILGMGDHARPQSPHEVFQEALGVLRKRLASSVAVEPLIAEAEKQVAYWRERQRAEKCLEDGISADGETYTPIGDEAAWQGGYCNGRMSEADWWQKTLQLSPLPPLPTAEVGR